MKHMEKKPNVKTATALAKKTNQIRAFYDTLKSAYGSQGWWPLLKVKNAKSRKTVSYNPYHPGNYTYPKTQAQQFEICIGAILTQNTAWPNVEKALLNLKAAKILNPKKIAVMNASKLGIPIRPAGYFNQKAKKLKIFTKFYLALKNKTPTREALLSLWGIGPETADSILLYAYKKPEFVVDAYTCRILLEKKWISTNATYDKVKKIFESNLKKEYPIFQEYHALLVKHAKQMKKEKKTSQSPQ